MDFSDSRKSHSQIIKKRDECEPVTSGQLITTTNHFTPLSNLKVHSVDWSGLQEQSEWISTQNMHKTKKQHRIGIKIPTIVNGRITHSGDSNPTAAEKKTTRLSGTNFKNSEYKVKIEGDSHVEEVLQG